MFDRVSDLSDSLTGGSGYSDDADPGPLAEMLDDDEQLTHVLANSGTIEHTQDGRETTIEPSGDHDAYVLVTDERVLFVLGDQPQEVDVEIRLQDLTASHVRSGLLNSKLAVKTEDEQVVFSPDEGDLEAAEDYIDRIGDCWSEMATAFAQARREIREFEAECEDGGNPRERALSARSHLSKARHSATKDDDAPSEKIQARIDEVAADIDRRRIGAWLERAERGVDDAAAARDDGEWTGAVLEPLVDARQSADRAAENADDADGLPDDAEDRIAVVRDRTDSIGSEFLDAVAANVQAAQTADDLGEAVEHWTTAAERYRAAVDAGWDGIADVSGEVLEYQLAWVNAERFHALTSHADALESAGDATDDTDEATEYFEAAESALERAADLLRSSSIDPADGVEDDLDRIEEKKLETSGWEFGNA